MASTDAVQPYDPKVLAVLESTFGTVPNPAGSQAIEVIDIDLGPAEQGDVRPTKDRTANRDETLEFVEGRVQPIPFSLSTSVKSRADADDAPMEDALYQAAQLARTINASTSVVYNITQAPTLQGLSVYLAHGPAASCVMAEQGRGGVIRSLSWEFGDKEVLLKAAGAFIGKYHLGSSDSVTLADGVGTSLTHASGEEYRFGISGTQQGGWYTIESENIKATAMNYSTRVMTIERGALSSSGAAHSAKPMRPYVPTLTLSGSPISEANCTVTIDSIATRCTRGVVTLNTGADHLPPETGSKYIQGLKVGRVSVEAEVDLVLTRSQVMLLGKATQRKAVAVAIACGTGAGGVVTLNLPTAEMIAPPVPVPNEGVTVVTLRFRVRGATGGDSFNVTLT